MSRHINKQELISKIRELAGLTNDEKSALLELLNEKKMYGLVWENHEEAVEEQLREQLPVLREVPERRIVAHGTQPASVAAAAGETPAYQQVPNHIIIEAENLHALVALTYTHAGKIDVMYLDPPYNTGNKDFVYNDSYVDTEDSYRHSKWLSFMEKRLRIAKTLLSDKGVVFISIDDNEQANLKLLCDEVFSEGCFVTNFVWQSTAGSNTGTDIITVTENILVYVKNRQVAQFDGMLISEEAFPYSDEYESIRGKYSLDKLDRRRVGGHYSDALNYPIEMPDETKRYPGGGEQKSTEGWNYLWSKTKVAWGLQNGFIVFKKGKDGWNVYNKRYSRIDNEGNLLERTIPFRNLILSDQFNTAQGTAEITSIFGVRTFDFPKPSRLIKHLLLTSVRTNKNALILDFFAGSGTTLHATMQLNAEDGGHRQCILVTNNENGICENVTYERNKRVIQGYTTPKGEQVAGLTQNNLRYYKADFVSREPSSKNKRELVSAATDLLCIKENLYEEVKMTCCGRTLRPGYVRRFMEGEREMMIIYEPAVIKYVVEELKQWSGIANPLQQKIKVYVFSDGQYAYNDDFQDVSSQVELCALPAAILNAYQRVLPRRKERPLGAPELTEEDMLEL